MSALNPGYNFLWFVVTQPVFLFVLGAALLVKIFEVVYPTWKRQRKFEKGNLWRTDQDALRRLRAMTPTEFEYFIADLFTKLGFQTTRIGGPGDGGIDVIAVKDGKKHYIQCKKFITQQVSVGALRDFYGALAGKASTAEGYFITTNIFTLDAKRFAEGKPLELIDGNRLVEYIKMAETK